MAKQVFQVVGVGDAGPHGAPVTVLTAQVDLDLHTEQAARDELARLHTGAGPVVVDASAVFVAVAGLRLLLSCVEQLRRSGRPAELVVSRHLRRVARVVGQGPGQLRLTVPDALAHVGGAGLGPWARMAGAAPVPRPNRAETEMDERGAAPETPSHESGGPA